MKKIKKIAFCALVSAFVSTTTLFAAARPSVDGHAVVADAGSMPKGLFAKTVGYLPGDSVSVTNPYTGTTINVLVLGSIDPSEGVAILLSPEAADRLGIRRGANVQVKITKRVGEVDEAVSGSAVIADDTDIEPSTATRKSELPEPSLSGEDSLVSSVSDEPEVVSLVGDSDDESEDATKDEGNEIALSPTPLSEDDGKKVADSEKSEPVSDALAKSVAENSASEAVTDELPPYEAIASVNSDKEPSTATSSDSEKNGAKRAKGALSDDELYQKENTAPVFEVVDSNAPSLSRGKKARSEAVDGRAPELERAGSAKAEAVDGRAPKMGEDSKNKLTEAVSETVPSLEGVDLMSGVESGAIVLVPASDNPPTESDKEKAEATKKAEDERLAVAKAYREREAAAKAEALKDAKDAKAELNNNESKVASEKGSDEKKDAKADSKKGSKKNTENTKTSGTGFDNYIVDNVQKLKAGYYVQIASLSDTSNIKGIVSTYSNKYPIEIVPSEVKKNSYQIMIGPLGVDEYGTVLERFKSRGYRDSFIRKVK